MYEKIEKEKKERKEKKRNIHKCKRKKNIKKFRIFKEKVSHKTQRRRRSWKCSALENFIIYNIISYHKVQSLYVCMYVCRDQSSIRKIYRCEKSLKKMTHPPKCRFCLQINSMQRQILLFIYYA